MADAAVRTDLRQALHRLLAVAAEVALDLQLGVDVVAQLRDLVVRKIANLRLRGKAELGTHVVRGRAADPEDVRQPDLEPLLIRKVDPCDTCQSSPRSLALPLLVARVRAD